MTQRIRVDYVVRLFAMPIALNQRVCALAACYVAMMCIAIAVNLPPILLTTLSAELGGPSGLTLEQLGRIGAAVFAGATAGILFSGPLADRWGVKPFAVLGNALIAAGLAMLGLAGDYGAVLPGVFLMGLGAGILDMLLSPIVSALQPHRRAVAMNWLHSFYCTGGVAAVLTGGWAMKCGASWRTVSLAAIAVPVLVGLGFLLLTMPPLFSEEHGRTRLRHLCRERFFLALMAAMALIGAVELALVQWLPAYAEKGLGFSRWTGGIALLVFSAAMGAGRIAVGMLGRRLGVFTIMIAFTAGLFVTVAAGCLAPPAAVALGACMAAGLAVSCLWPTVLAVASDAFPHGGGSMFGLLGATGNFGGLIMPWIVGAVADVSSLRLGLGTTALCPLLLLALLLWMRAMRGRPGE